MSTHAQHISLLPISSKLSVVYGRWCLPRASRRNPLAFARLGIRKWLLGFALLRKVFGTTGAMERTSDTARRTHRSESLFQVADLIHHFTVCNFHSTIVTNQGGFCYNLQILPNVNVHVLGRESKIEISGTPRVNWNLWNAESKLKPLERRK